MVGIVRIYNIFLVCRVVFFVFSMFSKWFLRVLIDRVNIVMVGRVFLFVFFNFMVLSDF